MSVEKVRGKINACIYILDGAIQIRAYREGDAGMNTAYNGPPPFSKEYLRHTGENYRACDAGLPATPEALQFALGQLVELVTELGREVFVEGGTPTCEG